MKYSGILVGSALSLLAWSCGNNTSEGGQKGTAAGPDILAANLDTTVNPAQDFFDYANGGWIKSNPIPDEQKSWGIAYLVQEDLYNRLKTINEQALKQADNAIAKKIAAFWSSGMDTVALKQQGVEQLQPEMQLIDNIKTKEDVLNVIAQLNRKGFSPLFNGYVAQDDMNSEKMAFNLHQGGLGLPNRDYYFNTDERTRKIREAYPAHIETMLGLAGIADGKNKSAAIFKLETSLAKVSRKLEDLRDPYKNYNKYAVSGLQKLTADIDWKKWLTEAGINNLDTVIVGQPEFFTAINNALKTESIDTWKDYLKWQVIRSTAPFLNPQLEDARFDFYGKTLSGVKKQKPRWKRVLDEEEDAMGEALGQLFVKEYFNEKAKKRYNDMVEDIREALKDRIKKLTWMSEPTKAKALDKLAKMRKKVGYPDKWKDFSAMNIKAQSYVRNVIAAREWWYNYEIAKLGKPVDREEWSMTPQTYNAYYNPSNNEIVLPAGIFTVPGKRDEELDDALVYGYAAASTIGHEITHGFDDQGAQYDAEGNLKNWWTKDDEKNFKARTEVMINQFNKYIAVDDLHVNGKATVGENIADLGGVLLGWDAFVKKEQYKKGEKIAGLNPGQRFFLGYSLGWLYNTRKESLAQQILTDVHSPAKYRVNGPFSDVDAFYEVFKVKPGDGMYIADSLRVRIW
ncbi:M13 family metallopeptidase [Taibaiella chishuiensis]|uniref:Endothelin-converting enzyme n=1 Tax=Taibaiella chishuiensis TaxID=1434707 RepID=A0A2P8D1C8_9BACT|nr:M13 family metallopeptidase [Taibaiella chishuiensis]PSK91024.1 endothelin-converting enzyme [Taibaiella chishuiensis]